MRTGADYRAALRDGRKVVVMGGGTIADVTTHPATAAMVEEYALWYDRHADPAWRDRLVAPDGTAWAFTPPRSARDVAAIGRAIRDTIFASAGNVTHTPLYGHLIAMGMLTAAETRGAGARHIANAEAYRRHVAETGRFLTFCGGAAIIGQRLHPDPAERVPVKIVRETDRGIVVRGRLGMHTSPAYAEDVYVGTLTGLQLDGHPIGFVVPVAAPGVTTLCRKPAAREADRFLAPLSGRYDELDGQMWLDDVAIPWERVFALDPAPEAIPRWLRWHHLCGWLAKAEFTLGLALALTDAMSLKEHDATIEYLVDIIAEVQIVRSCIAAAEHDPEYTASGYCVPNHAHLAAGGISLFKARQRITELLRIVPGSSLVVAPGDSDLKLPELAQGLEESFGGGGYTARQRAALLQLAWDHVSSALDGRESAFELHASGGLPGWRHWLRRSFRDYNALANGVLDFLDLAMPPIDVSGIGTAPVAARRTVSPPRSDKG
ncbi:MAG TPA: 4-hydroxyphenylacetate 3-hydroxylase N-terminal domain-containing protein [Stellaceae bacterium]|nr:4-hydroxyphenylacetate 3-hydroxylase N-terminal domain-containing protein [Stellaceae bacterium]